VTVEPRHIKQAEAFITRIAFSRGEDSDPEETLRAWRRSEGMADGLIEGASEESARGTVEEIRAALDAGGTLTLPDIEEILRRDFEAAFQLGWVCHARRDKRSDEEAAAEAAAEAERELAGG
jgi:hypothetical protein